MTGLTVFLYPNQKSNTLKILFRNISRDFADAMMMAETIHSYYPKIVQIHNYPAGNSYKVKLTNWKTLNNKVLYKLGMSLTEEDCSRLANATPMAIEAVLYQLKKIVDDSTLLERGEQEESPQKLKTKNTFFKKGSELGGGDYAEDLQLNIGQNKKQERVYGNGKPHTTSHQLSRAQQLKQILSLIKQKVSIVEKSLQRKDGQIRQLEQILKEAGQVSNHSQPHDV